MKSKITLFIAVFIAWCVINWQPHAELLIIDRDHLVIGIFASLLIAIFMGDIFAQRTQLFFQPRRYFWLCVYIPLFLWDCLKANCVMAALILRPAIHRDAGIVKVKTTLKSDVGLAFLANHLTLTHNTIAIDIEREKGILYIHWLTARDGRAGKEAQAIVERKEKILRKIFE
jgi:multicomponent Na+:H+ antiporter subunit E